ncbi:hypothetical protein V5O48_008003, partial [Marasmius crinis-equi]
LPTREQFQKAKQSYAYETGKFHLAIAGASGAGKSSLVNALRGLRDSEGGAAEVGVVETTSKIKRYPEPDKSLPFVWFDVPGAGTLNVPRAEYFNNMGLYLLDAIIVVYNDRFTDTDIAITRNCVCYDIPCYIVRSKSDVHITNLARASMTETDDEAEPSKADIQRAKAVYEGQTRENVRDSLREADLPMNSKLYLVSNRCIRPLVKAGKEGRPIADVKSPFMLDEGKLLEDLLLDATARRPPRSYESVIAGLRGQIKRLISGGRQWFKSQG